MNKNNKAKKKYKVIITMGDPNGIGPELICRSFGRKKNLLDRILIIGREEPLFYYCQLYSIKKFWETTNSLSSNHHSPITLYSINKMDFKFNPGIPSVGGGYISGKSIDIACEILKKNPDYILVTCPLNKKSLVEAGFNFYGHTELLAKKFNLLSEDVCMHLFGEKLRVSLVTTHPPLKKVPQLINKKRVYKAIYLTWQMLKKLKLDHRPIGVCGLNPHAGEKGKIGEEEIKILEPAIKKAQSKCINVKGPYPADTIFYRAYHGEFSAVIAMYHDQGLGPLKLMHFNKSVNITLGLPIIRTSVDHGTAYDLVGKSKASIISFERAIEIGKKLKTN